MDNNGMERADSQPTLLTQAYSSVKIRGQL